MVARLAPSAHGCLLLAVGSAGRGGFAIGSEMSGGVRNVTCARTLPGLADDAQPNRLAFSLIRVSTQTATRGWGAAPTRAESTSSQASVGAAS